MDNQKLSVRVEALEGPDREIFLAAYAACYPNGGTPWASDASHQARFELLVAKEAWLDAAMSLVPEGWFTSDFHSGPSGGNWWNLSRIADGDQKYTSVMGSGKTPALALCAAALKSRGL